MSIQHWPTQEKPREKLIEKGPQALSDAELLGIIFRTGRRGKTAVDLARDVLMQFGGFRGLLNASTLEFTNTAGMSLIRYSELQAVLEIGKRYLAENIRRKDSVKNSWATRQFLMAQLRDKSREVFAGIFLDSQNQVIIYEELMMGTLQAAHVYPREIIKRILHHNAASVILAHNHPSGIAEPSEDDQLLTRKLKQALELIHARLVDHVIVGDGQFYSFAEKGFS